LETKALILIALGSNLPSPRWGGPEAVLHAAAAELEVRGLRLARRSTLWRTAPVPVSDQPWYVNAVAAVETGLDAAGVMGVLHEVEQHFGRVRVARNEARILDLDLVDFRGHVSGPGEWPELPHPRAAGRGFVLRPLAQVAPGWIEPRSGAPVADLLARLDPGSVTEDTGVTL
jgi:2-amino-4-hydroxy-6-hydroxymethyldihydropteridine diphosphokinase